MTQLAFQDAVKREVNEETGLDFEPSTLLMVETAQGQWYRFVFVGTIVGKFHSMTYLPYVQVDL